MNLLSMRLSTGIVAITAGSPLPAACLPRLFRLCRTRAKLVRLYANHCYMRIITVALVLSALGTIASISAPGQPTAAAKTASQICRPLGWERVAARWGTQYIVRNDDFLGTDECLSTTGKPDFIVTRTGTPDHGGVIAFPDIFRGCWFNICSAHSGLPARVITLANPRVTWYTAGDPAGVWNRALDLWFDRAPITTGHPTGAELMIWLGTRGYASWSRFPIMTIDGTQWYEDHWKTRPAKGSGWPLIIFRRVHPAGHVRQLPLQPFVHAAENLRVLKSSFYLLEVAGGDEISRGGRGLATTWFRFLA
jgi:hypothetical protein